MGTLHYLSPCKSDTEAETNLTKQRTLRLPAIYTQSKHHGLYSITVKIKGKHSPVSPSLGSAHINAVIYKCQQEYSKALDLPNIHLLPFDHTYGGI